MSNTTKIVLLSGPIAVGKSSVSTALVQTFGFALLKSSAYLKVMAAENGLEPSRRTLQDLGDRLDVETTFAWVVTSVATPQIRDNPLQTFWLFDSVRKKEQVTHFRDQFSPHLLHVHLDADERTLQQRFADRAQGEMSAEEALLAYSKSIRHSNENCSRGLISIADVVIDVSTRSSSSTALHISNVLGGQRE